MEGSPTRSLPIGVFGTLGPAFPKAQGTPAPPLSHPSAQAAGVATLSSMSVQPTSLSRIRTPIVGPSSSHPRPTLRPATLPSNKWGARLVEQPAPRGTDGIGHRRDIEANRLNLAPSGPVDADDIDMKGAEMDITIELDGAPRVAAESLRHRGLTAGRWGLDATGGEWGFEGMSPDDRHSILEQAIEDYTEGKRMIHAIVTDGRLTGSRRIVGQVIADALRDVAEDTMPLIFQVADPIDGRTRDQVDRLAGQGEAIAYLTNRLEEVAR